jgi:hypothetical protein
MIGYVAIEPQPTEPSVCKIEVNFIAQAPLGTDAEAVANNHHPDHQFGIDRGPANGAVEWSQLPTSLSIDRKRWSVGTSRSIENS